MNGGGNQLFWLPARLNMSQTGLFGMVQQTLWFLNISICDRVVDVADLAVKSYLDLSKAIKLAHSRSDVPPGSKLSFFGEFRSCKIKTKLGKCLLPHSAIEPLNFSILNSSSIVKYTFLLVNGTNLMSSLDIEDSFVTRIIDVEAKGIG